MDPYGDNTAQENGPAATPPEPVAPTPPTPTDVPDVVLAEQVVYTRAIQTTAWAGLARWVSGMTIPTGVIMAYIQRLGYTTTAQVDANTETGTVTIVTTGSQLPEATWAAFAGGSGAATVEVTKAWTAFTESTTTAVPGRDTLIALWFHLERNGIGPLTIFRRFDGTAYWIVLTTYGPVPAGIAEAFVYGAPDPDDLVRVRVVARTNPPLAGEPFYVTFQNDAVLEVQTGVDLTGLETVRDVVPIATETAQAPAQVQEIRTLDLIVTPAYFLQAMQPTIPREGDLWATAIGGTVQKWTNGAWVVVPGATATNEGSVQVGRLARVLSWFGTALGFNARADAQQSIAIGAHAQATNIHSTALGVGALVQAARSFGVGPNVLVAADKPDTGMLKADTVEIVRSSTLTGETGLRLRSANDYAMLLTVGNDSRMRVNGAAAIEAREDNVRLNDVWAIDAGSGILGVIGSDGRFQINVAFGTGQYEVPRGNSVYTMGEADALLAAKAASSHLHTGTYSPVSHLHTGTYSPVSHTHDERYYTEGEVNAVIDARVSKPTIENDLAFVASGTLPTTNTRILGTMTLGPLVNGVIYDISAWMLVKALNLTTAGSASNLQVAIQIGTGSEATEDYAVYYATQATCIVKWRFTGYTGTGGNINIVGKCRHNGGSTQSIMGSGFVTGIAHPRS